MLTLDEAMEKLEKEKLYVIDYNIESYGHWELIIYNNQEEFKVIEEYSGETISEILEKCLKEKVKNFEIYKSYFPYKYGITYTNIRPTEKEDNREIITTELDVYETKIEDVNHFLTLLDNIYETMVDCYEFEHFDKVEQYL